VETVRLFVYGTLKRGGRHAARLPGAAFERNAATATGYALHDLGEYPALVRSATGVVHGELHRVPASDLPALDDFEECPELYQREEIVLEDGSRAVAYLMSPDAVSAFARVTSGRWGPRFG
jgi:gamma-glutamylcyclotransferase (GGCT)/AIG2-like uncharacterized protein YtfP